MRIVSLLPAATELVCAAGLADRLVGRSHACDYPASITDRPVVTRANLSDAQPSGVIDAQVRAWAADDRPLYTVDGPALRALRPGLVVTQDLCDVCAVAPAQVEAAVDGLTPRPQVLRLAPGGIDAVLHDLVRLGDAAGHRPAAVDAADRLRERLEHATAAPPHPDTAPRVLFLEWRDPPFSAGHWNPDLLHRAGALSVLPVDAGAKSRVITDAELAPLMPDLIFVAACGFDAARARTEWKALPPDHALKRLHERSHARLVFADGNAHFNRPGPRLIDSLEALREPIAQIHGARRP